MVENVLEILSKVRQLLLSDNTIMQYTKGSVIIAYRSTLLEAPPLPSICMSIEISPFSYIYEVADGYIRFECWDASDVVNCYNMAKRLKELLHRTRIAMPHTVVVFELKELSMPKFDANVRAYNLSTNFRVRFLGV